MADADYATAAKRSLESLAARLRHEPAGSEHALIAAATYLRDSGAVAAKIGEATTAPRITERVDAVTIHVYAPRLRFRPGESCELAIALEIDPGWHLYGENPAADFLIPTSVSCENSGSLTVRHVDRPEAKSMLDPVLRQTVNIYQGRVWFRLNITADTAAPAGDVALKLRVVTQACDESRCLPARTTELRVPVTIDPGIVAESR